MAPSHELQQLGLTAVDASRRIDSECSICLSAFTDAVMTRCGHVFCFICLSHWLTEHQTCPACRANLQQALYRPQPPAQQQFAQQQYQTYTQAQWDQYSQQRRASIPQRATEQIRRNSCTVPQAQTPPQSESRDQRRSSAQATNLIQIDCDEDIPDINKAVRRLRERPETSDTYNHAEFRLYGKAILLRWVQILERMHGQWITIEDLLWFFESEACAVLATPGPTFLDRRATDKRAMLKRFFREIMRMMWDLY